MPNDKLTQKVRILYEVSLAKWRIDDQNNPKNREWCLYVFDKNKGEWIAANECDRDGEYVTIKHVQVIDE